MLNYFFNVEEIHPGEVHKKLENGENILLLDVREPHEYAEIRVDNSILIPRGNLEQNHKTGYEEEFTNLESAKDQEIIVICRSGQRSLYGSKYLKDNGYKNVKSMKSGVIGWAQNNLPVTGNIMHHA